MKCLLLTRHGTSRDTAADTWRRRLRHWNPRGPSSHALSKAADIPYVWMFEDVDYERQLSTFLEQEVASAPSLYFADDGASCSVFLWFVLFDEALDLQWFIQQILHCDKDIDIKRHMHACKTGNGP